MTEPPESRASPIAAWEPDVALRIHPVYAEALALRDAGAPDDVIAAQLDIPVESVAALLEIAGAKLAALKRTPG